MQIFLIMIPVQMYVNVLCVEMQLSLHMQHGHHDERQPRFKRCVILHLRDEYPVRQRVCLREH